MDENTEKAQTLFLNEYFSEDLSKCVLTKPEKDIIQLSLDYVDYRVGKAKYVLGQALDFALLAQCISKIDPSLNKFTPSMDEEVLFSKYELITKRNNKDSNTLTLKVDAHQFGIRKIEENVLKLFHSIDRSSYPSAYVYNTGQWKKNIELLVFAFRLSEAGRFQFCKALISKGCEIFVSNTFYGTDIVKPRFFEMVLMKFPRTMSGINGGMVLQAIGYAYAVTDRPHLCISADKVRTGSARQKRLGDIDGFCGIDLELSIEVKDIDLTTENVEKELRSFLSKIKNTSIKGIVLAKSFSKEAHVQISSEGTLPLSIEKLYEIVCFWDWSKQNNAMNAVMHFLSHIEQEPEVVQKVLDFISNPDLADETNVA